MPAVGSQIWSAARLLSFLLHASDRPTAEGIPNLSRESVSYSARPSRSISRAMRALLNFAMLLLRCVPAFLRSRRKQAIVELALRQQLAAYARRGTKPRLTPLDRAFWVALSRVWSGWGEALVIVKPDTVVRWHRKGFRLYWRGTSQPGPGRPPICEEVQALIVRLARENGWRARKIQAELEKPGFTVSLATVSRYLPKRRPDEQERLRKVSHDIPFFRSGAGSNPFSRRIRLIANGERIRTGRTANRDECGQRPRSSAEAAVSGSERPGLDAKTPRKRGVFWDGRGQRARNLCNRGLDGGAVSRERTRL